MSSNAAAWSPSHHDHLIFKWIKLDGKSQSWVASAFGISQPTVSRIIQRYERWQAHASEREDGRLDHTERLRAQRWLTFERNEVFLASCLRIAKEMEGFTEVSKETVSRSTLHPNDPGNFRTETASIDRSGVAARFLRLAFRINMEQLKLASLDPAPPALPLSESELAQLDRDALATAQEFEQAKNRAAQQAQTFADAGFAAPASYPTPENADSLKNDPFAWPVPPPPAATDTPTRRASEDERSSTSIEPTPQADFASSFAPCPLVSRSPCLPASPSSTLNLEPGTLNPSPGQPANLTITLSPSHQPSITPQPPTWNSEPATCNSVPPIHPLNNLNNDPTPEIAATSTDTTNYEIPHSQENFSRLNNDYPSDIPLTILVPPKVTDCELPAPSLAEPPEFAR